MKLFAAKALHPNTIVGFVAFILLLFSSLVSWGAEPIETTQPVSFTNRDNGGIEIPIIEPRFLIEADARDEAAKAAVAAKKSAPTVSAKTGGPTAMLSVE